MITNELQKQQIKQIIHKHFGHLLQNIEGDFKKNYDKKQNNFLIAGLSSSLRANMVFTSSWESKSGNAAEACVRDLASMRYSSTNVPNIINPLSLKHNLNNTQEQQIVITNIDPKNEDLAGVIATFRASHGKETITQRSLSELYKQTRQFIEVDKAFSKPVDLGFYDNVWHLLEIKAGGALDSSKTPAEVDKMLMLYVLLGQENAQIHFATVYNKDGEGNTWKGSIKKYMAPELLWIGKDLWNEVLPSGVSFDDFIEIYNQAVDELKLPQRIEALIQSTISK